MKATTPVEGEEVSTTLKVFRLNHNFSLPVHHTDQAACFDLALQATHGTEIKGFTCMNRPIKRVFNGKVGLGAGERVLLPTGFIFDIPKGYSVRIHPRSGLSLEKGLILANCEGVIDSDYTNEVMVMIHNSSDNPVTLNYGDRIAQAELVKNVDYDIVESQERPSLKGNRVGGFGSTGIMINPGRITLNKPAEQLPTLSVVNETVDTTDLDKDVKWFKEKVKETVKKRTRKPHSEETKAKMKARYEERRKQPIILTTGD